MALNIPKAGKEQAVAFYTERLGFVPTDRVRDVGVFMRAPGDTDHHTLLLGHRADRADANHVAYEVATVDEVLFRYQVQGPLAAERVERAFGGPLPPARFFHSIPVSMSGRDIRALRHNMAGQDGYEFIGRWPDAAAVKDALMSAGEPLGLVHVGGFAHASASVESGWIPSPIPGIYTDPDLLDYRTWLPLYGIEGQRPLNGSFFSGDIEDYYCTPYELGYGRSISFNHDFIGREALAKARDDVRRAKVTLVFGADDVRRVLGADAGCCLSYARHRVEAGVEAGAVLERLVLSRAVKWHSEDRVIRNGNHTIVFA